MSAHLQADEALPGEEEDGAIGASGSSGGGTQQRALALRRSARIHASPRKNPRYEAADDSPPLERKKPAKKEPRPTKRHKAGTGQPASGTKATSATATGPRADAPSRTTAVAADEFEPLLGDLGWHTLLSPRTASNEEITGFVSLWARQWLQSPAIFPSLLRRLLLKHYPDVRKRTLDVVLTRFISFHPQYVEDILDVFIDLMIPSEPESRPKLVYDNKEAPFRDILEMFATSNERDIISLPRLNVVCRRIVQHLHQRFLRISSDNNALEVWLTECLCLASLDLREEYFELFFYNCYRNLLTSISPSGHTRAKLFQRSPKVQVSTETQQGKIEAIIMREYKITGGILLVRSAVSQLLSLHQKLISTQTKQDYSVPSIKTLEEQLFLPFVSILYIYFSQQQTTHSEQLLHQLLHSSSIQLKDTGGPISTVASLMDMLLHIFLWPDHQKEPYAEAVNKSLKKLFYFYKKDQAIKPWSWFHNHFLKPLLNVLAETNQGNEQEGFITAVNINSSASRVAKDLLGRIFSNKTYEHLLYGSLGILEKDNKQFLWEYEKQSKSLLRSFIDVVSYYGKAVEAKVADMWEASVMKSLSAGPDSSIECQHSWQNLKCYLSIYPDLPSRWSEAFDRVFHFFIRQLLEQESDHGICVLEKILHFFLLESDASFSEKNHSVPTLSGYVEPFLALLRYLSTVQRSDSRTRLLRYMHRLLSIISTNCLYSSTFEYSISASLATSSSASVPVFSLQASPILAPQAPDVVVGDSSRQKYSFANLGVFSASLAPVDEQELDSSHASFVSPNQPKVNVRVHSPRRASASRKASVDRKKEPSLLHATERLNQIALLFMGSLTLVQEGRKSSDRGKSEEGMDLEDEDSIRNKLAAEDICFLFDSLMGKGVTEAFLRCLATSGDPLVREILVDIMMALSYYERSNLLSNTNLTDILVSLLHDSTPTVATKGENYVKRVIKEVNDHDKNLVKMLLDRAEQGNQGEPKDERILSSIILAIIEKNKGMGDESTFFVRDIIGRISDRIFVKADRGNNPPSASSSSYSCSASPQPLLLSLLVSLNTFLFTSPIMCQQDRLFVPIDTLKLALVDAANSGEEVRHKQRNLLSTTAHHSIEFLSGLQEERKESNEANHARKCLNLVAEHSPLIVEGLCSTSEKERSESTLILRRLIEAQHFLGDEVVQRIATLINFQLHSAILQSQARSVFCLRSAFEQLFPNTRSTLSGIYSGI